MTVRVVVPYTDLRSETVAALEATGTAYNAIRMDCDEDYWGLLAGLWTKGETFVLVEQDIVINHSTITTLDACPSSWCSFGYGYFSLESYHGLGCVKFGSSLMAAVPDLLDRVALMSDEGHPAKHWCRLDAWMQALLAASGQTRCAHVPPVTHLHRSPSHGCS